MVEPDALGRHLLRAHVGVRTRELARHRQERVVAHARQAEVRQLRAVVRRDQDVLRLDVAVDHAGLVRGLEPLGQRGHQLRCAPVVALGRLVLRAQLVEEVLQRPRAFDQLLRDPRRVAGAIESQRAHEARVREPSARARLALEALERARVHAVGPHELERHRPAQVRVVRFPHLAHAALREEAPQLELRDALPGREGDSRAVTRAARRVLAACAAPKEAQGPPPALAVEDKLLDLRPQRRVARKLRLLRRPRGELSRSTLRPRSHEALEERPRAIHSRVRVLRAHGSARKRGTPLSTHCEELPTPNLSLSTTAPPARAAAAPAGRRLGRLRRRRRGRSLGRRGRAGRWRARRCRTASAREGSRSAAS